MTILIVGGDTHAGKLLRAVFPDSESINVRDGGVIHRDGRYDAMVIADDRVRGISMNHWKGVAERYGIKRVITAQSF